MFKRQHTSYWLLVLGALVALMYSYLIDWHNVSVDVGALRYFAMRLDWTDLTTYHNGFYPSLPIMAVKMVGVDAWSLFGTIVSNLLYGYCLALGYRIILHFVPHQEAALVGTAFLAISPGFFSIFTSAMPDSLMVAFFLSGVYLLTHSSKWLLGGVFLGLAAATRYHGLLLAALTFLLLVRPSKQSIRSMLWCLTGFALAYSPQTIFTLIATGSLFENDQLYNVFKTFYRADIGDAAQLQLPKHLLGVVTHKPEVFWPTYLRLLGSNALYILFPVVVAVAVWKQQRVVRYLAIFIGIYVLIASLGGSPRMYAPIATLMAIVLATAYKALHYTKLRIGLLLCLLHFLAQDNMLNLSVQRQNQRTNRVIREAIHSSHPNVHREAIFSSYYDYTWEGVPGLIGYGTKRAWLRHGDAWFAQQFEAPDLQGSTDDFLKYCLRNKIEFLVLNKSKLGNKLHIGLTQSPKVSLLVHIPNTRPRITHQYQILSKQFDEIYLYRVLAE